MATMQQVAMESKEGKAFLRKVVRDNQRLGWNEEWDVRANASTDWKLRFTRVVKGEIGEADSEIVVDTDLEAGRAKSGDIRQSFSDCKPVQMATIKGLTLRGADLVTLCGVLSQGAGINIAAHAGSSSSSQHGLSFYQAELSGEGFKGLSIGSQAVAVNGQRVICGDVSID